MNAIFETLKYMNEKVSSIDIIKSNPDFKFVGTLKGGIPVFELKKEPKCECCGRIAAYCECEDHR